MNQINLLLLQSVRSQGFPKLKKPAGFRGNISRAPSGWPWLLVCRENGTVGSNPSSPAAAFTVQVPYNIYLPQTRMVLLAEGK